MRVYSFLTASAAPFRHWNPEPTRTADWIRRPVSYGCGTDCIELQCRLETTMAKNEQRPIPQPQKQPGQGDFGKKDQGQRDNAGYQTPQDHDEHWTPPSQSPEKK